ncbi:MFS transporter [Elongatibacter sediminis]|uniref:MFS transporter n=1 Tax=Elongatibacter sediminis TaxID=3119006 RepID=A0AAW9RMX8_9GAMM
MRGFSEDLSLALTPETRREFRLAATLSGVIGLRMLGLFLILPVFMVLARDVPGFTPWLGGLALGAYGLTQALLQQPFGWLSDRLGRRPVLLGGLVLFALGGVVAATAESMTGLVVGRALQGCGAVAGVAMAFAADYTRPERRPVVLAVIGIGIGAAFLLSLLASVPVASRLGLSGLFWLTVGLAVVGMLLVLTTPRGGAVATDAASDALTTTPESRWEIRILAAAVFLLHAVMTALFVVLPGRLEVRYGLELAAHWHLYVPAMLGSLIFALPVLAWTGRTGRERTVLPWAFAVLGAALLLLQAASDVTWAAVALAVYFSAFNVLEAAMPARVARLSGTRGRGRRMGLYSTFQFLGAFVGGAGGGLVLQRSGAASTLLIAAGLSLLWSAVIAVVRSR